MDKHELEALLYQDESDSLDFKQAQYRFDRQDDIVKSELLKDILAFANSWSQMGAYILVGVKEVKGGLSEVLGVKSHLDDNKLQQFVTSKTQKPLDFHYTGFEFNGCSIGIIEIPVQTRPLYLRKAYGKVEANTVYVRRGSSTDVASPEEVAKMGAADIASRKTPELKFEFADPFKRNLLGLSTHVETHLLSLADGEELPDYNPGGGSLGFPSGNRHFYRDAFAYRQRSARVFPVRVCVKNLGNSTANNLHWEGFLPGDNTDLILERYSDLPSPPQSTSALLRGADLPSVHCEDDLDFESRADGTKIIIRFGRCLPKQEIFSSSVFLIGAFRSCNLEILGKLYADEVADPIEQKLTIEVSVSEIEWCFSDLLETFPEMD